MGLLDTPILNIVMKGRHAHSGSRVSSVGSGLSHEVSLSNLVVVEVSLLVLGAISSVGLAIHIDNIVVHVLILMDVLIVGGVSVGDLIGVSAESGLQLDPVLSLLSESDVLDDIIISISEVLDLFVVSGITISEFITLLGLLKLYPVLSLLSESGILDDVVLSISEVFDLFIVGGISIAELIALLSFLNLEESVVGNNILIEDPEVEGSGGSEESSNSNVFHL